MKNVELLYRWEKVDRMLAYDYKLHLWFYDVKLYLIGDEWHIDLNGPVVSLESEVHHLRSVTDEHIALIKQREQENKNWAAFQNCRKRTCVCKKCVKFCNCGQCVEKKTKCVIDE